TASDWGTWNNHLLGMLIWGDATDETDDRGRPIVGETLLIIFNSGAEPARFTLPTVEGDGIWAELVDTAHRELHVVDSGLVELARSRLGMLRYGENRRWASDPARG